MRQPTAAPAFLVLLLLSPAAAQNAAPAPFRPERPPAKLQPWPADRAQGAAAIDEKLCRKWLRTLASEAMGGRATGTPGFERAARFVAARFAEFGLEPAGDDGTFFQKVPFVGFTVDRGHSRLSLAGAGGEVLREIRFGKGFTGRCRRSERVDFPVAFAVLRRPADLDEIEDLGEKALVVVDRSRRRFGALTALRLALWRRPPGLLVFVDDAAASVATPAPAVFAGRGRRSVRRGIRRNFYYLTRERAAALLSAAGLDPKRLDEKGPWTAEPTGFRLRLEIAVGQHEVFAANVLGLLRGRDPKLEREVVGIGSHLDHLGRGPDGRVYPGADDDASGTTVVMALARAFAKNPKRPRRSLLFMAFCGEELGLIGSSWYAEHPVVPHERMAAELQLDMVGRREENPRTGEGPEENVNTLHLVGTKKLSDELHRICLDVNRKWGGFVFEYDEEDVFWRSDHVNFARHDVPVAFFFTGFHPQYHRPEDTADRIDFPKLVRVAELVYGIAFELAERPAFLTRDRAWSEIAKQRRRRR